MNGSSSQSGMGSDVKKSVETSTTVKTIVTQRDADGNVVNVKQTQSAPKQTINTEKLKENSDSSRKEVTDPFN